MTAVGKQDLIFDPALDVFNRQRVLSPLTVLSGPNNNGKSLTLRWLKYALGRNAYFVGTNRFYHVYHFSSGLRDPNELDNFENNFRNHFNDESHNHEQNVFDLGRVITGLSNQRRSQLLSLCSQLLGNTLSLNKADPLNDLSPHYIDMDGQNLSVGSTGTRLLITMLGLCMDDRFQTILIDEPELGLSPRIQTALSTFFQDPVTRAEYFPHLQRIFLATHSHLFLARGDVSSNFVVTKNGTRIKLEQVADINSFHRLQFNLLGNAFETMFFPSAIVIVEGKTDFAYLDRVIQLRFADRRVTVIPSGGDVKKKAHALREAFGDLDKSPFRARIFVILDKVHQPGLTEELVRMGLLSANIVKWHENGIEYFYPASVLCSIYACSIDRLSELQIENDVVSLNGISKRKSDLANTVIGQLDASTELPAELHEQFLDPLANAIA